LGKSSGIDAVCHFFNISLGLIPSLSLSSELDNIARFCGRDFIITGCVSGCLTAAKAQTGE
jgi:hypothetical protein